MTTLNYAGIGARATPTAVLASVTIVAGWLWRTGEHLTTGDVQAPVAPLRTVHRNRAPSHGEAAARKVYATLYGTPTSLNSHAAWS